MSSTRPSAPDQAERDRIVGELDRSMLVEAGAGSGKTEMLARRMAAGIADGTYELERMAAVTFTRKAAAELRGRFQIALEAELQYVERPDLSAADAAAEAAADRAGRLRHALSNLERFFAGTIHSFCARLLRERPVEAGVSPGFTELDDAEERLLQEASWRDFRAQAHAAGDEDFHALLEAGIQAKDLDKAFATICLHEDVEFPPGDAPVPDGTRAWTQVERFWRELQTRMPDPMDPAHKCKTLERAERFALVWRAYQRGERDPGLLADLLRIWEPQPGATGKWWSDDRAAARRMAIDVEQLHDQFRSATVLPYLASWREYLYCRVVPLLARARGAAAAERRRRNALSFNDLLIVTARVLRENADVRDALQRKFRWLFVDEFQDTDPVQAEIVFLLAAAPGGSDCPPDGGPLDWRAVPLRPGALFVVGDPKQSIYRFRRADIDIYNEVRTRLAGPDGRGIVTLTTNFRSAPALCTWANGVFEERFPCEPTSHAPRFAPLTPSPDRMDSPPHLAVIDLPAPIAARGVPAEEAARIARYIRAEVNAGRRAFGDFLILTRRKKALRPYADALEALQIPVEVTGAGAFGESKEARDLALLLAALADPQDAVALVGVLRGALFGLSDRDLFAFRQAGGYFSLFAEMPPDVRRAGRAVARDENARRAGRVVADEPVARVLAALTSLRRWYQWTRRLPTGAALERILEESGYLALAAASPGGVEAGDLLHAVDRVRAVVEEGFTLADAAEALAGWSGLDEDGPEESVEVDSLPLEPGRPDVVRVMNLHKAKGLEAAVVFLADPLGGFPPRVDVRVVREGPTPHGYFPIFKDTDNFPGLLLAQPPGWAAHEAAERQYFDAEEDRLLYVAATRARDLLVAGRYTGGAGRSTLAWEPIVARLGLAPSLQVPDTVTLPPPVTIDLSVDAASRASSAAAAAHERAQSPSWSASSVTAELKRLPRVTIEPADAPDLPDPTRAIVPDTPSHRADAGLAWGTLVHGLLEHAMRHRDASRADLRRLAMWLTMEEPRPRDVIDHALDTVEAVAREPFWQEARASAECHEEVPFAAIEPGPVVPRVVTGVIDLVHGAGGRWTAIDYKTDVAADAQARASYAQQVQAYERAWARISGGAVTARLIEARASRPGT